MDIHTNPGPTLNDKHSLDIIHLNTRSIRNKMDNLSPVVDSFHVVRFSETHLDADTASNTLLLDSFDETLRKDRTQHGGGLMVYTSNMLKYRRRHDLESPIIETLWVEINFKEINVLICCLYRSDFIASPSVFITELQNSIEIALDYTPHIIILGDININFSNLTNNQLRDCVSLFSLKNVINEPTRVTDNSATLIDPIIVSDVVETLDSGTLDVDGFISDQKATYISIQISTNLSNSYFREIWNYKTADFNSLNNLIQNFDWGTIINETFSVDQACENFTIFFFKFCDECIPRKKVLIRQNDKPWFSSELRYNIKLRDRLRKTYFKSKRHSDRMYPP